MNARLLHTVALVGALVVAAPDATMAADPFWINGESGPSPGRPDSFAELAEALSPAVVFIEVRKPVDEMAGQFGIPREGPEAASGSGFVLSADGYIATNNHVVEDASKITVRFLDGLELPAEIVGRDPDTDLALIKVEATRPLVVAPLGDSDVVRVGEWVVAIGNPYGFEHSVTVGILSAKGRSLSQSSYDDFLQTDASINPGNSGGPLIDTGGRVIGINSAIKATITGGTTGIGFAIPINMAKALLPQLKENGSVTRGWLGVQIQEVTPALAKGYGLDSSRGAIVGMVFPGSPAAGKFEIGDVIVDFAGAKINTVSDLPRAVAQTIPGTEVAIVVVREGKPKTIKAVIDDKDVLDQALGEPALLPPAPESPYREWGFELESLQPSIQQRLGLEGAGSGVRIVAIEPGSPAEEAGLQVGDLILKADRQEIGSLEDLKKPLEGSLVVLVVQRENQTFIRALEREKNE